MKLQRQTVLGDAGGGCLGTKAKPTTASALDSAAGALDEGEEEREREREIVASGLKLLMGDRKEYGSSDFV